MKLEELFQEQGFELTNDVREMLKENKSTLILPSKVEAKLEYISKTEILKIDSDFQTAKELILIILSNFSDTFFKSTINNTNEFVLDGYKVLNAEILKAQVKLYTKQTSPYKAILTLLIKNGIIEEGRNYSTGVRSKEYRLTKTFFGKGTVIYNLKSEVLRRRIQKVDEERLRKVLSCPIAYNELLNRPQITFPTQEEAKEHLIALTKAGATNKSGKKIVYLRTRNRKDFENCVFLEDYLDILSYLQKIIIPIIVSDRGGNRVITAFNFLPSVLRGLVKVDGQSLSEADYSCLHPNIIQHIYGGTNEEIITHSKVAEYLGITRAEAKVEHLSFFNKSWEAMMKSPLFKYYANNETEMMSNIYKSKEANGYKQTSKDCFFFETSIMKDNVKTMRDRGITVLYCFDAIYTPSHTLEEVTAIMNQTANTYSLLTKV